MTRINLVRPEDLSDQHLFAEWREMVRIPTAVRKLKQQLFGCLPDTYRMSTGHVRFFYNKMKFLRERYVMITGELLSRGFNVTLREADEVFYNGIEMRHQVVWRPSPTEIAISVERISTRLKEKPKLHRYYGQQKDPEFFISRYK